MRYHALATDYDGTLAERGQVDPRAWDALERFRASGRKLLLVTGRVMDELRAVCPRLDLFDRVVAENGALLHDPSDSRETLLTRRPPDDFVAALRAAGAPALSVGRVVLATWRPFETTAEAMIRERGLDLDVILNKRAVMILPRGVDKATGLSAALADLAIAPERVVGVGDAENDLAFLKICGLGVAVANALPMVKAQADRVTTADHGQGVVELIENLLKEDPSGP